MRALFSGHLLCSPLVAFFYCYLIHTTPGSHLPPSHTFPNNRHVSSQGVAPSSQHTHTPAQRPTTDNQQHFAGPQPAPHGPHTSMETEEREVFQGQSEMDKARSDTDAALSLHLVHPVQSVSHHDPLSPHFHHDSAPSRMLYERRVKWAEYVQAKETQRQQAQKHKAGRLDCTHTRFPKNTVSFVGTPGFSVGTGQSQSSQKRVSQSLTISSIPTPLTDTQTTSHNKEWAKGGDVTRNLMDQTSYVPQQTKYRRRRKLRHVHNRRKGVRDSNNLIKRTLNIRNEYDWREAVNYTSAQSVLSTVDFHRNIAIHDKHSVSPNVQLSDSSQTDDNVRDNKHDVTSSSDRWSAPFTAHEKTVVDGVVDRKTKNGRTVLPFTRDETIRKPDWIDSLPSPSSKPHLVHSRYLTPRHLYQPRVRRSEDGDCVRGRCGPPTSSQLPSRTARQASQASSRPRTHNPSLVGKSHGSGLSSQSSSDASSDLNKLGVKGADKGHDQSGAAAEAEENLFGKAAYLSGQQVMRLKPAAAVPGKQLPAHHFTVELWIKPEGGQYDPAIIIALTDTCGGFSPGGYWYVGIRTQPHQHHIVGGVGAAPPTDARFFFSLKTARAIKTSTVWAHRRYQHSVWTHLAASYDGVKMALYINGALLAVSHDQSREVFPPAAAAACKALTVGGVLQSAAAAVSHSPLTPRTPYNFRGTVEEMRLWQRALSHAEIRQHVHDVMTSSGQGGKDRPRHFSPVRSPALRPGPDQTEAWRQERDLYLYDSLNNLQYWSVEEGKLPVRLVPSDLIFQPHDLSVSVPLCGQTVCDNPDVVLSYVHNWQLHSAKQVRYRVINLMNHDGTSPTVTKPQIRKQHKFLNRAFRPYNITFQLEVHEVKNSTLRQRLVMLGCELDLIGDGICNEECKHDQTGQDGGDCDVNRTVCPGHKKGNGRCDFECNKHYHNWDGGDCCLPNIDTHYTCHDPQSPYRAYVMVAELREMVGLPGDTHLNVFFAVFSDRGVQQLKATHLIGLATFPWENHVYSVQGGAVIQHQTFGREGQMDSLVHEVGHVLGLWHVHHGVSEVECSDPCAETEASMLLGDLCSDTAPTSHNVHCRDPHPAHDHCGLPTTFTHTPYSNYMSYADDNCTDHFTQQQVGRMHCYLDLVYQPWRETPKPSPVPLPPTVVSADTDSVTVAWVEPLGREVLHKGSLCGLCDKRGALVQFAAIASSPSPSSSWSPEQATGPPDAEPCVPSTRAWLPEVVYPDLAVCSKKNPCRLDLVLHVPVVAHTLTLWVTWNADGIRRLKLVYEDGTTSVVKTAPALCDMPFTLTLNDSRRLAKVQVYTRTPFTAIDALQVVSLPQHASCQACQPITYRVYREPGIKGRHFRLSEQTYFTDREVVRGVKYRYWIQTASGHINSHPSPVLHYTHGQHFCGDGHVDSDEGEECDDGNIVAGDGCDVTCHMEHSFHCKGGPSVCYQHDGDGVCEDFERHSSVLDCGFYTPHSYQDQWAHDAMANPNHQLPTCPARLATGAPDRTQHCGPIVDPRTSWFPCGAQFDTGNFWIEFYIARPVVATAVIVHVAADGRTEADPVPKTVSVRLIKVDNSTELLTPDPVTVDCRHKQVFISVLHDLSTPFYKTTGVRLSFRSANISIAAVRVRSYRYLDPVNLASCGPQEVYNPHTGICLTQACSRAPCRPVDVSHGTPLCTGQAEGDVCRVTCVKGYRPQSPTMELTCRGGHWVQSQPVACVPVQCGRAAMPGAVVTCAYGTTFGQNCTFRCQPPASLHGSDNWIVCEEDGLWSTPRAQCLVTCPPPLHVQHVRIRKKRCRSGSLAVGSRCKMRCKKGYHVAGSRRANRRVFRVTCEADGTWSGGHCQRVTCPKFDPIFTGLITCTDDVKVASRCTLRCPGSDEAQIVTCSADGQWNTPLVRCLHFDDVVCPDPDDVANLVLHCSPPVVGAQCAVSCPSPDESAMFNTRQSERRGQVWEIVHSVTCTGKGQWFPPLDRVACVEQCSEEFIGDEWCDPRNNRPYCQWDGGDCCQSTLGKEVKPFLQSCGAACACKDPMAIENRGQQSQDDGKAMRRDRG